MILHGYINGTESNCENENNVTVTTSRYFQQQQFAICPHRIYKY